MSTPEPSINRYTLVPVSRRHCLDYEVGEDSATQEELRIGHLHLEVLPPVFSVPSSSGARAGVGGLHSPSDDTQSWRERLDLLFQKLLGRGSGDRSRAGDNPRRVVGQQVKDRAMPNGPRCEGASDQARPLCRVLSHSSLEPRMEKARRKRYPHVGEQKAEAHSHGQKRCQEWPVAEEGVGE